MHSSYRHNVVQHFEVSLCKKGKHLMHISIVENLQKVFLGCQWCKLLYRHLLKLDELLDTIYTHCKLVQKVKNKVAAIYIVICCLARKVGN